MGNARRSSVQTMKMFHSSNMKSALFLCYASVLWLGISPGTSAAALSREGQTQASSPSVVIEDQFFMDNPDLKEERDTVETASQILASEGYRSTNLQEISAALAARSREIIAQRSPEEWQRKAIRLYPPLGIAGSEFNALFLKHYKELMESSPSFADEPSWPVLLAKRCDDELRSNQAKSPENVPSIPPKPAVETKTSIQTSPVQNVPPKQTGHPYQTAFSIIILALATAAPRFYAFKKADAHFGMKPGQAESRNDSRLWGDALKHGAILYVVVAFSAAIRTLFVDADLGFLDRFAVSAAVGTLIGLCVTLPLCILDAIWQSVRRQATNRLAHR